MVGPQHVSDSASASSVNPSPKATMQLAYNSKKSPIGLPERTPKKAEYLIALATWGSVCKVSFNFLVETYSFWRVSKNSVLINKHQRNHRETSFVPISSREMVVGAFGTKNGSAYYVENDTSRRLIAYGGFPKMVGFPNNHGVFLLKMIILGCELGVPAFEETPVLN